MSGSKAIKATAFGQRESKSKSKAYGLSNIIAETDKMALRMTPLLCLLLPILVVSAKTWLDSFEDTAEESPVDDETIMEKRFQLGYENWRLRCEKFEEELNQTSPVNTRIAGGELAARGMFPYQVGLVIQQSGGDLFKCGGSLITLQFVLTAAHCLIDAIGARIYTGATIFADSEDSAEVILVTHRDFFTHPDYLGFGGYNDLALIRLTRKVITSDRVQPIELAGEFMHQTFLEGQVVTLSGWGRLGDSPGSETRILQYLDAEVINQERCICYFLPGLVGQRHLCTDGQNGRGGCNGDSGGPLVYHWRNVSYLIGVTSFGSVEGCEVGAPTAYARITAYLPWIRQQTAMTN
ncbi:brachyurin [Drosophila takahashii]|uniref:brachyurin n=1 Tax=Drosophila takahashii TaxID=29030 RepID=UPI001CF8BF2A|nr:brachyurin [Drosophila takahashii]